MEPICIGALIVLILIGWYFFRQAPPSADRRSSQRGGPRGSFGLEQDEDLYDYFGYGKADEDDSDDDEEDDGWYFEDDD